MKKIAVILGVMCSSIPAVAHDYYSVAVDATTHAVTETAWQAAETTTAWAPQTVAQVAARGITLVPPSGDLHTQQVWEVDLGLLQPDGNIIHLLGTATVSSVVARGKQSLAVVSADLVGVQEDRCAAQLTATLDVVTHHTVAQKMNLNCWGRKIAVATAERIRE